jgi:hypothetical protein
MAQPPLVLDPLAALDIPPGLFNVASGPLDLPDHGYTSGAVWAPDTCSLDRLYPTACLSPPYTSFVLDAVEPVAQAFPFAIYASLLTGAAGYSGAEAERRVRARLVHTEQSLAEKALWGGTATLFTNQQNYAGTMPGTAGGTGVAGVAGGIFAQLANVGAAAGFQDLGTATSVTEGLSLLEQAAADSYYGPAVVHARPRIASYAGKNGLFRVCGLPPGPTNNYMFTQNLNVWNFGNGYAGTGPTGQAVDATSEYMWATGRVIVWRSPDIFVSDPDVLLDRTSNQRGLYAFRNYMIGVECFAATVKVTRV